MLELLPNLAYVNQALTELMQAAEQMILGGISEPIVLVGHSGSGKSLILQCLADRLGFVFSQVDCLAHLNLTQLKTLLDTTIPTYAPLP